MLTQFLYRDGKPYEDGGHQHDTVLDALERRDGRALKKAIRDDMIEGGRRFVRALTAAETP
jgi:DNA-binding GntR family transcriptional regulator